MKVEATSFPGLLLARADATPRSVATRTAWSGTWHEQGWADAVSATALVRAAMADAGVGPTTVVAVATSPRAEWPLAVCAAQSLGAVVLPVAVDADPTAIRSLLDTHRCTLWVVEDEEQQDKVLEAGPEDVELLVLDPRGVTLGGAVRAWADVVASEDTDAAEGALREAVAALDPDAPAAFVNTSATAEGAAVEIWTNRRFAAAAGDGGASEDRGVTLGEGDEYLSFLPTHWPVEQRAVLCDAVATGAVVNFGSRVGGVLADLREVRPTAVQAPAELWDAMALDVRARIDDANRSGRRALTGLVEGRSGLLVSLAARRLRTKLGLTRIRHAVSLGRPDAATTAFFGRLGVDLTVVADERAPASGPGSDTQEETPS